MNQEWICKKRKIESVSSSKTKSPQQGDLRLSSPPSGQGAGGGTRIRDRRVPADLRVDSLTTLPSTPPSKDKDNSGVPNKLKQVP
ncbi:hypothetical protein PoB_003363500 [Plakobranchus ocellatus]|uniref:Uncharacterized protein n=1 Tax=Plakobranchus ocellatus TaxID=259542 RepID=A0AAV4AIH1_9GAST|nr:hypothetical protein PoB_003363500 [Plakobranchus ocellatus]